MLWIVSVRCKKLWHDLVARTFTLIAPVWRVMHQVSCSSEMVPNAPKWKEMNQNMRLGSNGMDRERSLWKNLARHRGTNFCINCTSLARFRAIAKRSQMHPNGKKPPNHEFRVQWCVSWAFVVKNWTFTLIAQVWRILRQVSCSSETVTNAPKRKETHQNMSLGYNCVDQECSLWKILTRHRGTNFCINCTSFGHFALSFML